MLTSIDPVTSRLTAHVTCPVISLHKTSLRKNLEITGSSITVLFLTHI